MRMFMDGKTFIAAESGFSGGKMEQKRKAEIRAAARMVGGKYHIVYFTTSNVLLGESCDAFPYMINASVYLVDHLIMPETDNMPT